jgi:hypothetical protein
MACLLYQVMWEAEIMRIMDSGKPGQKTNFLRPLSQGRKAGRVNVILATAGSVKEEDCSPGWPGQQTRPYPQNNQSKTSWRHGSSSNMPASQAQSPEFKSSTVKKLLFLHLHSHIQIHHKNTDAT